MRPLVVALALGVLIPASRGSAPVHADGGRDDRDAHFRPPVRPARDADFLRGSPAMVTLGQALYFDKVLSGNRNISCATCHSPVVATTDGLSINIGTGGQGLGVLRDAGTFPPGPRDPVERGQRNMPALFNQGNKEFVRLFWDGRIAVDASVPQGFRSPAGDALPHGFDHLLEAISIFAPTEQQEMTGRPGANELADASAVSPFTGVWDGVVARLRAIPEYVDLFRAAFPEIGGAADIRIVHVGKAIGAFQAVAFRSDDSPFDRYLKGDDRALSEAAQAGMKLFYGKARCADCHGGTFQTDHRFHAIGVPQIGPGFGGVGHAGREDFGREGVTGDARDRYRFRTPSLRNVLLSGPWGHDGFFNSLEKMVRHHLDAESSLRTADPSQRILPSRPDLDALDLIAFEDPGTTDAIAERIEIRPRRLDDREVSDLMEFLRSLTDSSAMDMRKTVPKRVPSGLPLAEIK
jgi:cytochrome c peroxidase